MPKMQRTFEVVGVLGRGGFATVYRAIERDGTGFERPVALKVLRATSPSAEALARFQDEARLLALLSDRAFVRAEPPVRLEDHWVVVMEALEGVTLSTAGVLPPRAAMEVVAECARALHAAAHTIGPDGRRLGLVHRDLKPANLVVTPTGEVRILDVGIARADFAGRGAATEGNVPGTPRFVAPERMAGDDGPAADIYSLGVVLSDLVGEAVESDVTSDSVQDCAGLLALAAAMRATDPADRPTAREVETRAQDLSAALGGMTLRDWADEHVGSAELDTDDDWVGRRLTTPGTPIPRVVPALGLLAVGLLGIAGVGAALRAPDAPADPQVVLSPTPRPVPPTPVVAPPPDPPPVLASAVEVRVRTKPWGTVRIDGRSWSTDEAVELVVGRHVLHLESKDGDRHTWPITVTEHGKNAFCWDFRSGKEC